MAERNVIERLDEAIEAILAGRRDALAVPDADVAELLLVAADLRGVPDSSLKARLRRELFPEVSEMQQTEPGSHTVVPYFVLDGAADFIDFVTNAFGATELLRAPAHEGRIPYASLSVGDSLIEVGDANEQWGAMTMPIHLYVDDADAVYARAVAAGGTSLMAPVDQFYGDREAAVQDRWGNHWYIATRHEGGRPAGFRSVTVNVRTTGTDRAMEFLRGAFGAETFGEVTRAAEMIVHAEMRIGDSVVELGEAHGAWGPMKINIHLFVPDPDAAYASELAAGAKSLMPPSDRPHGERSAGVEDPFGNLWWLARRLA
jgi:PhnB protein